MLKASVLMRKNKTWLVHEVLKNEIEKAKIELDRWTGMQAFKQGRFVHEYRDYKELQKEHRILYQERIDHLHSEISKIRQSKHL